MSRFTRNGQRTASKDTNWQQQCQRGRLLCSSKTAVFIQYKKQTRCLKYSTCTLQNVHYHSPWRHQKSKSNVSSHLIQAVVVDCNVKFGTACGTDGYQAKIQRGYFFRTYLLKPNDIYIYMSYRSAKLQTQHFKYLFNKYTYWIF